MASQITRVSLVCLTVFVGANQRKHQSSASLAFMRGTHRWPLDSPHKGRVTQKMFPFDDIIMIIISITGPEQDGSLIEHIFKCIFQNTNTMCVLVLADNVETIILGLYSLRGKTTYRKIAWSLEAARFMFRLFQSLWNLTSISAAILPRCLSNFRTIRSL